MHTVPESWSKYTTAFQVRRGFVLNFSEWSVYDGDLESFQNDWVEIAMEKASSLKVSDSPEFLKHSLDHFLGREALRHRHITHRLRKMYLLHFKSMLNLQLG